MSKKINKLEKLLLNSETEAGIILDVKFVEELFSVISETYKIVDNNKISDLVSNRINLGPLKATLKKLEEYCDKKD